MKLRSIGVTWFRQRYGSAPGMVRVSRYYPTEESWAREPAWWFEIPIANIQAAPSGEMHLVCERRDAPGDFHCLRVPNAYVLENRPSLFRSDRGVVSLFLAAEGAHKFEDQRGSGQVPFAQFVVE